MAAAPYAAVPQVDDSEEVASNISDPSHFSCPAKDTSSSGAAFQPLPLDMSNLGGNPTESAENNNESSVLHRLGSVVRSSSPIAYEMLEEDDDEAPFSGRSSRNLPSRVDTPLPGDSPKQQEDDDDEAVNTPLESPVYSDHGGIPPAEEEPALRSVSSSTLSHPMPGLQSIRGAYVGNIERLERSAEHLSMSSSDLGSEIRKMDRLQKKHSVSSAFNYSAPVRSVSEGSRFMQPNNNREEEEEEEEDYYAYHYRSPHLDDGTASFRTVASGDACQLARHLFHDFDGVHFTPDEIMSNAPSRTVSRRSLATAAGGHIPKEDADAVYYPAPVPMMLNLPPLLSKKSGYETANRKREIFGATHPSEAVVVGKSVASVPPVQIPPIPEEELPSSPRGLRSGKKQQQQRRRLTKVPPQLRAGTYFDRTSPPRTPPPILPEMKQVSAVATLDNILDESVHAPVSAFIDHPFVGPLGAKSYVKEKGQPQQKKKKHASRSEVSLRPQTMEVSDSQEASTLQHTSDGHYDAKGRTGDEGGLSIYEEGENSEERQAEEEEEGDDEDEREEEEENDEVLLEENYFGPPTTLLAELQARKIELQQRRRTAAASAGMHSTLLQLETVAQRQSQQRRQRPVTLAWEDPGRLREQRDQGDDDEDVPLGILYPESRMRAPEGRPVGLLEKKEMEEGEPLSRRQARLRGQPPPLSSSSSRQKMPSNNGKEEEEEEENEDEHEGETLAQRMRRLRATRVPSVANDFATEVLAEMNNTVGLGDEESEKASNEEEEEEEEEEKKATNKDPPREETLGERRRRLQTLKPRGSVEYPVGMPHMSQSYYGNQQPANRVSVYQMPAGFNRSQQYAMASGGAHTRYGASPYGRHSAIGLGKPYGYNAKPAQASIDPGQREVIDRWRKSVVK